MGYDKNEYGKFIINPEEIKIVQRIGSFKIVASLMKKRSSWNMIEEAITSRNMGPTLTHTIQKGLAVPGTLYREELKNKWKTTAKFGNPLEQYRMVQFADITEGAKHIKKNARDFILRTLDTSRFMKQEKSSFISWTEQRWSVMENNKD